MCDLLNEQSLASTIEARRVGLVEFGLYADVNRSTITRVVTAAIAWYGRVIGADVGCCGIFFIGQVTRIQEP
jgi:hypothetical protein